MRRIAVVMFSFLFPMCVTAQSLSLEKRFCNGFFNSTSLKPVSQVVNLTVLPVRQGKAIQTTGAVPHIQLNVEPQTDINTELSRLAFSIPGVENRPTVVSLAGARGLWLQKSVPIVEPKAIVAGREFAHIHSDGSLHLPLPLARAIELSEKGWGERHPWAEERDGWQGLVMIYTPLNNDQLKIVVELIVESYNHVTGKSLTVSDLN